MPDRQQRRDEAVKLLQHYFETAFRRAGGKWDNDNNVEIAEAVDAIIAAATPDMLSDHARAVEELRSKVTRVEEVINEGHSKV